MPKTPSKRPAKSQAPVPVHVSTHRWSQHGPAPPGHVLIGPGMTQEEKMAQKRANAFKTELEGGRRRTYKRSRRNRRKTRRS